MAPDRDIYQLEAGEAFALLASDERRRLLEVLHERDSDELPLDREEAIEAVYDANGSDIDGTRADQLAIELHHNHLPRMSEADVIAWDRETNAISPGPAFVELRPYVKLHKELKG
jgi:hypothetical protein